MAWIESHQSLATHRKTLALRRLLGISRAQAIGHLHLLWWWCLDNAPDGNLEGLDPSDLGIAMDWSGDANTIIGCLVKVGFIDDDMHVHAWAEYAGKLLIQRASNAEKQRRHREKQSQLLLSPPRNRDITVMSPSRNRATVPNRTQPNRTNKEYIYKKNYGQFENVLLSDAEYEKLKTQFDSSLQEKIEELSVGIASKGYKYKSHYATILNWARKREKETGGTDGTNQRYSKQGGTKLPDRDTGYTPAPPDPALDALVAAQRDGDTTKH